MASSTTVPAKAPLVFEIKGNSLDDGPGIRSVVFFKGCPLSCLWCHNPESQRPGRELSFDEGTCVGCDTCIGLCPEKALDRRNPGFIDRDSCTLCLMCADNCPSGALAAVGKTMTVADIVREIEKDTPFFRTSDGGATLTGGEPTLFIDFVSRLAGELKKRRIHLLLETCGFFNYEIFLRRLYPKLDMIFFDIKIIDPAEHLRLCGISNETILDNFRKLHRRYMEGGVEILPRVPLVPGLTATDENLRAIARFLGEARARRISLLQNNPLWFEKTRMLGRVPTVENNDMRRWIERERMEEIRSMFHGFEIV